MRNIVGSKIRSARIEKKLTQEALAVHLQLQGHKFTRTTIAKIEGGFRQINDIEISIFALALGVSIAWLFDEVGSENS